MRLRGRRAEALLSSAWLRRQHVHLFDLDSTTLALYNPCVLQGALKPGAGELGHRVLDEVRDWLHLLRKEDRETLLLVSAAIDLLAERGPGLGRPLVDTLTGSRLPNLKELRPGSGGSSEVRVLFAFDPRRNAVLLVAGDKSSNWKGWYKVAIPLAEERYWSHLGNS
ncbi:hypothetical protein GCM10009665_02270 [Kitasatospora nipponensis]|uniref:Uncharacterized protein n=1 Tax=Kitasatospora nipponensis TaxID=258049 RepID=A0ABN1VLV3_9ACTN